MRPLAEGLLETAGPGSATASVGLSVGSLFAVAEGETMAGIFIGVTGIITAIGSIVASVYTAKMRATDIARDNTISELRTLVEMLKTELREAREEIRQLHGRGKL